MKPRFQKYSQKFFQKFLPLVTVKKFLFYSDATKNKQIDNQSIGNSKRIPKMTIILNFDAFQRKSLKTKFGYRYFFGFLRFSQKTWCYL